MKFQGKKVIVTGAHRSMGRDMAKEFTIEGADVVISYRNNAAGAEELVAEMAELGRNVKALYADFSNNDAINTFFDEAVSYLGKIDILINNAGIFVPERLLDLSPDDLQLSFQVNLIAPFMLTQLCAKNMIKNNNKGNIINISSIAGTITLPRGLAYSVSKAALNKFTKNAALDLAEYGIRVNAIAPGIIAAGMNQEKLDTQREAWDERVSNIPLKRAGTPEDITSMVIFLASEEASWTTGKIFEVDGGHVL